MHAWFWHKPADWNIMSVVHHVYMRDRSWHFRRMIDFRVFILSCPFLHIYTSFSTHVLNSNYLFFYLVLNGPRKNHWSSPDFPAPLIQVAHMGGHRADQFGLHSNPCLAATDDAGTGTSGWLLGLGVDADLIHDNVAMIGAWESKLA